MQFLAKVIDPNPEESSVVIIEIIPALQLPTIQLVVGAPEQAAAEALVSQCAELGVNEIVFFRADRTQGTDDQGFPRLKNREERLHRVIESALQQSGPHLGGTTVRFSPSLHSLLGEASQKSEQIRLICSFRDTAIPMTKLPQELQLSQQSAGAPQGNSPDKESIKITSKNAELSLIVGPEGGLTEKEESVALEWGYMPVSLSRKTLRVETAATLAVGVAALLRR